MAQQLSILKYVLDKFNNGRGKNKILPIYYNTNTVLLSVFKKSKLKQMMMYMF